jgi:hypothetical protein
MFLSVLIVLTTASTGPAQETRPEQLPQAAPAASESTKLQELLNTAGKTRLSLHGVMGFGFDQIDVGKTTSGDTISISGGGGLGGGAGIAFGLSRSLDLDLDLGFQAGGLTPAVDNAEGSFTRGYFLATLKYKKPTSDTGQFKFGVGLGTYFGGKMKIERTDVFFSKEEVDYDPAVGLHFTGEFERFIRPNVSFNVGAKIYFVEYEAKSYKLNSVDVPVSSLKEDVRNLNGSGMDFMIGINMYFN